MPFDLCRSSLPRALWWAALWLGALIILLPVRAAPAAEFTSEQKKAIEAIIRDYLSNNPEVLLDALQAAEDKLKSESKDKAAQALSARRRELLDDPESPVGGNPRGDVSLVEFFDYRCPYCKQVEPGSRANTTPCIAR
jgi:protein-disulfide isomerase